MAADVNIWADTARPRFTEIVGPYKKWGGDNSDAFYLFSPVDPERTYRTVRAIKNRFGSTNEAGVFEMRDTDSWRGIGPHAGVELARRFDSAWSAFVRADFATMIGRQRQGFFETSSTTGANGQFLTGDTHVSGSIDNPVLQIQAGVNWQPCTAVAVFLGYQYEYWWDAGRLNLEGSHGYFYDQGVLVQTQITF